MLWEFNCRGVVMLTRCIENGRVKCDRYWPADQEPAIYGDLQTVILREEVEEHWHIKHIQLSVVSIYSFTFASAFAVHCERAKAI